MNEYEELAGNIGPLGRRSRLMRGLFALVGAAAVGLVLAIRGARPLAQLLLFPILWVAAIYVFQFSEKTCVALASRGLRDLDGGPEPITDPGELAFVRRQARRVHGQALVTAAALTAFAVWLASLD